MTISDVESAAVNLLAEIRRSRNVYEVKDEEIAALREENRALRDAVQILKTQRKTDKDTITKWQSHVEFLEKKLADQTNPANDANHLQSEGSIQESEPEPIFTQQTQMTGNILSSSNPQSIPETPVRPEETHAPRESLLSQNLESQYNLPSDPPIEDYLDRKDLKSSQLSGKEWHPADFKLNSQHNVFNIPNNLNFTAKRRCMHGVDCTECEQFYGLADQPKDAINALNTNETHKNSRHRVDADKQATPPGFWRVDFSSQNANEDNQRSNEQALIEGKNRFKEAMNNGRYVFKDPEMREYVKRKLRKT